MIYPRTLYSGRGGYTIVQNDKERSLMISQGWVDPNEDNKENIAVVKLLERQEEPKESAKSMFPKTELEFHRQRGRPRRY